MKKKQGTIENFFGSKALISQKNDNKTDKSKTETKIENKKNEPNTLPINTKQKREPPLDLNENEKEENKNNIKTQKTSSSETKSILFREIVDVLLKVENCKGENSKDAVKELLSNLFIEIIQKYPADLPKIYYFLSSKVGPEYISPEFGIGEGILEKIVGKVIGISDKQLKEKLIELGDLGLVASEGKKNVKTMDAFSNFIKIGATKKIDLNQILNVYKNVAIKKGKSSQDEKVKLLCDLMFKSDKDEIKFLVRSLQKV